MPINTSPYIESTYVSIGWAQVRNQLMDFEHLLPEDKQFWFRARDHYRDFTSEDFDCMPVQKLYKSSIRGQETRGTEKWLRIPKHWLSGNPDNAEELHDLYTIIQTDLSRLLGDHSKYFRENVVVSFHLDGWVHENHLAHVVIIQGVNGTAPQYLQDAIDPYHDEDEMPEPQVDDRTRPLPDELIV